ncbi:beta strand repeat-containing protein [uncultured Nostoc sp.]|uniref:beta strand repeat-containing protein n=1 Tax=uncultured Nostoc sp. TaxID=340711 RepID=UPI0035CAFA87
MVNRNQSVNKQRQLYQFLVATALLTGSLFQFLAPVLADGTTAGTSISNTATATYEDPNNPGTTINATSNAVIVTVAEVAGITVTASGVTDSNGGSVGVNDLLIYTYTLTNVGNDPTKFRVPNLATTTGPGTVSGILPNGGTANNLQYSTDGGTTWQNITGTEVITASVAPGGTVLVRVPVTVQAGAQTNDVITVTLGNTPGNAQNQLRSPDGGDVYTVDNADGTVTGEVAGAPVNGTREASATEQIKVGSTLKSYALATVLKVRGVVDTNNTTQITDDKIPYSLSLRVESNDPTNNGISPAALVGTPINVDGSNGNYILVSDAIPAGTQLAAAPTPPPGWQAVYTTEPVTTNANTANWKTFPLKGADTLPGVTRVGFINNPTTITSIAPGTTVNGFSIQLAVKSTATSPLTVSNIAQLFGQTPSTNAPVYDESGDQNPSNYDGSTPPPGTDTNGDGVPDTLPAASVSDGYINDSTDLTNTGTDTGNNNTGTGTGGEANSIILQTPVASGILNGPQNAPDATGPSGNNDDFTNKSSLVPAGTLPGTKLDPQSVGFTNTIKNNGTSTGNITLVPTKPTNQLDLPNGTKVTITYNSQSAVYTYDQATGNFTTASTPITISNVASGTLINYGIEVDLPANTSLSTDTIPDYTGDKEFGFPIPIVASIDTNGDGQPDSQNTTIDRVYTGFLKLLKVSRVLQGTGPVVQGNDGTFSIDPKKPAPGNIIEYQIQYTNISDPQSGTGNVILNANKVVITEDGTKTPNNWALDNDASGQIDTSNIVGSAKDSESATIQFFSGNSATSSGIDQTGTTANTDVAKYIDSVTDTIAPGIQRTFTFQRKVN